MTPTRNRPPAMAGEGVKVEVTRYADGGGSKSRTHECAKIKEMVRGLLAYFPEVAGGRKPNEGPAPSGLS